MEHILHDKTPDGSQTGPIHPEIEVRLTGRDGNAFSVMGNVTRAMRAAGVDEEEVAQYRIESTSGNYDNLLATAARWVSVS